MTAQQAAPVDMLAPNARTWKADDFVPMPPRLRQAIAGVFANFAEMAKTPEDRADNLAQAAKWGTP